MKVSTFGKNHVSENIIEKCHEAKAKRKLDSILTSIQASGFLTARLNKPYRYKDTLRARIDLGSKINVVDLQEVFFFSNHSSESTLSRKRDYHLPFSEYLLRIQTIEDSLQMTGVSFSKIESKNIQINGDTLKTKLHINTSTKRYIDDIVIKGLKKTPKNLKRFIQSRKLIYNKDNIKLVEQEINSSRIAKIARPSETLFKKDSTKLYVYVEKSNGNSLEGMLGLNNPDGEKTQINGFANLELINILNTAETLKLDYRNDGNDISTLNAFASFPFLLFNKIGADAGITITRRDSTYQNESLKAGLFYQPRLAYTYGLNYESLNSNDLSSNDQFGTFQKNGLNAKLIHSRNTGVSFDKIPDIYYNLNLGYYDRMVNVKKTNQWQLDATFQKIWHLNNKNEFLTRIRAFHLETEDLLFSELKQLGGIQSMRGFTENSIDSGSFGTLMTEYRRSFSTNFYAYTVADFGRFEDFSASEMRNIYGLGLGAAILTRSGLLSLSVVNGSFDEANLELSSVITHLNLRINF
ncbi:BamA/TamA family outer membrane protein [Nonlabens spongiae]|nr:hypothetical protein [Nonlabens spongiae]